MQCVNRTDARKLAEDPLSFALMLDTDQLEHAIATFVSVLNKRKPEPRWLK
jgi:hypothetical protein